MTQALIIGASGGIGSALATQLRGQGAHVTTLSRRDDGLDITDEASITHHLTPLQGQLFDLIVIATGALEIAGASPEKTIRQISAQALMDQFAVNAIGPALVMKHALPLLPKDRRAVMAALSARVGSIGDNRLGGWYGYRAAKAALNQMIRSTAIELARSHPQAICLALHPGTVATEFTRKYLGRHPVVPPTEAAQNILRVIDARTAYDSGGFYDWAGTPVPW